MTKSPTLVLGKALPLLTLIVRDGGKRSVSTLAAESGLPSATAHRLVATCEDLGFLMRFGRGRYLAGPALLALAHATDLNQLLKVTGAPVLAAVTRETGFTSHLGVFEEDMVTYLAKVEGDEGAVFTRVGLQLEAYCSGIGKALIAFLPDYERERYLAGGPFVALTNQTIVDKKALRAEFEKIRTRGYAIDDGEVAHGLTCLAVPVRNQSGAAVAALSTSTYRGPQTLLAKAHIALMQEASAQLERRLFPREFPSEGLAQ